MCRSDLRDSCMSKTEMSKNSSPRSNLFHYIKSLICCAMFSPMSSLKLFRSKSSLMNQKSSILRVINKILTRPCISGIDNFRSFITKSRFRVYETSIRVKTVINFNRYDFIDSHLRLKERVKVFCRLRRRLEIRYLSL
jgi:hypothetical protein